jgi:hypothetical protein
MVVVASLGADIVPGDFLIAKKNSSSNAVCHVTRVVFPDRLEVEWWKEKANAPPICPNAYQNILRYRLRELYPADSCTSVIYCHSVVDVAFIFSAEVVEHVWPDLAGMTKVFFMRQPNHLPFSLHVIDSFPSRIWFSLLSLKDLLWRMMSCKRQYHVCRRAESILFALESWRYISKFIPPVYYE